MRVYKLWAYKTKKKQWSRASQEAQKDKVQYRVQSDNRAQYLESLQSKKSHYHQVEVESQLRPQSHTCQKSLLYLEVKNLSDFKQAQICIVGKTLQ